MSQIIIHTFTKTEIETLYFERFDALCGHWPQLWSRELREKFDPLVFLADCLNYHPDEILGTFGGSVIKKGDPS